MDEYVGAVNVAVAEHVAGPHVTAAEPEYVGFVKVAAALHVAGEHVTATDEV